MELSVFLHTLRLFSAMCAVSNLREDAIDGARALEAFL
jgi:hypothetical protein